MGAQAGQAGQAERAERSWRGRVWRPAVIGALGLGLASLGLAFTGLPDQPKRPEQAAQAQARVVVPAVSAPKGRIIDVDVTIENAPVGGLSDFQGTLRYDPTVARIQEVLGLSDYRIFGVVIDNSNGEARFIGAKVTGPLLRSGAFLRFRMQAVGEVGDSTTLELEFASLNGPEGPIAHAVTSGRLTVTAPLALKADFTFTPAQPLVGQTVQFRDASTAEGTIVEWRWDFGDGTTATEQNPTHAYQEAGTYTVKLTVRDEQGNADTAEKTLEVFERGAPAPVKVRVFPNPATTRATFVYELPRGTSQAQLWVFTLDGQLVFNATLQLDTDRYRWDLRDRAKRPVPPGAYYYRVTALTAQGVSASPVGRLVIAR